MSGVMKGIIIYKGKYGATRQYAEWLAQELNIKAVPPQDSKAALETSDLVILGSSVYIGKLQLYKWLKENAAILSNKKLLLFVVCGTPPEEKEKLETYIQSSVPPAIRMQCRVYFLPGRLVYHRLSFMDKLLLRMGALISGDPNIKRAMLTDYDGIKKENLAELLSDARELSGETRMAEAR